MSLPEPAYSVFLQPDGGPFLSARHGQLPARSDRVVLMDDLSWSWAAVEGRIPGEFEPTTLALGFAAFTMSDLSWLHVGTRIVAFVQIDPNGTPGWSLYSEFVVSDVEFDADPTRRRKVRARVTAVDDSADLRSTFPDPSTGLFPTPPVTPWKRAISEVAYHSNIRLYAPRDIVWSLDWTAPTLPRWPEVSADEILARLLNTVTATSAEFGAGRHLTLMPLYTDPPANYEDLSTQSVMYNGGWRQYEFDPIMAPPQAFILAPLDRSVTTIPNLPFRPVGNSVELAPDAAAEQAGLVVIDGCLIEAPATASRSRGSAFTVAVLEGSVLQPDEEKVLQWEEGTTQVTGAGAREYGSISRTIPVFTLIRSHEIAADSVNERTKIAAEARRIAAKFLSTSTELGAQTQFDAFQIRVSSADSLDAAARLVRSLTPSTPGMYAPPSSTSTAVLIHHVDGDLVTHGTIKGFTIAGALDIAGGKLTYTATIAPGDPKLLDLSRSHRLSDSLGSYSYNTIDPDLSYSDLTLTRRT